MAEMNLTVSELARRTGVAQPVLHRFVSGETYNPNVLSIIPVANFFGVTVTQLLGEELMPAQRVPGSYSVAHSNTHQVPLIDWTILENWRGIDKFNVHKIKYQQVINTEKEVNPSMFALKIADSSMEPRFPEGTIIIVDPCLKMPVKNRSFVIVYRNKQKIATFKQLLSDGENFYLKSYNSDFKPLLMEKNDQLIGVVIEARFDLI